MSVQLETMRGMDIPYGYCHCGCGEQTPINPCNSYTQGYVKGEPRKYVNGHNNRSGPVAWKVEDRGFQTPCWVWQWTTSHFGHGQLMVGRGSTRKSTYAHKHEWEKVNGPVPGGYELHHLCEVPACCNPDHLALLTPQEHIQTHSPLTEDDVREIRRRYAAGERQKDIADDYGFTQAYISLICTRKQWANVV